MSILFNTVTTHAGAAVAGGIATFFALRNNPKFLTARVAAVFGNRAAVSLAGAPAAAPAPPPAPPKPK